jgi:hypothetical protein
LRGGDGTGVHDAIDVHLVPRQRREQIGEERGVGGAAAVGVEVRPDPHEVVGDAHAQRVPVVLGHGVEKPLDDVRT